MAHPHKSKDRTARIAGGGSDDGMSGGTVASKGKGGYSRKGYNDGGMIEGGASAKRLDRPGKKGTTVNVNVISLPGAGAGAGPAMPPMAPPMAGPGPAPMPPPRPPAMPPMPQAGPPSIRRYGGKVKC